MHNDLSDEDLERNDWYIVTETITLPISGMYETPQRIKIRTLTGVKPQ